LVEHEGRLLLIRHTYGSMEWDLPGGGAKRGEPPEAAAAREVREEVGITVSEISRVGSLRAGEDGRRVGTVVFSARAVNPELRPRRAEVYDEGWFEWDRLPRQLSPAAGRIIGLYGYGARRSIPYVRAPRAAGTRQATESPD
jgi:8-oxo-dGTP pyrophosphatase MutT (NUDIX family)